MTTTDWLSLVVVLICLLLSAFFAGSETALTASSRASMTRLEKHGNRRAGIVNRLLEQRERLLGALLFGNNAANIAADGGVQCARSPRARSCATDVLVCQIFCTRADDHRSPGAVAAQARRYERRRRSA